MIVDLNVNLLQYKTITTVSDFCLYISKINHSYLNFCGSSCSPSCKVDLSIVPPVNNCMCPLSGLVCVVLWRWECQLALYPSRHVPGSYTNHYSSPEENQKGRAKGRDCTLEKYLNSKIRKRSCLLLTWGQLTLLLSIHVCLYSNIFYLSFVTASCFYTPSPNHTPNPTLQHKFPMLN